MAAQTGSWDRRYFAGTRGQVLALLRRAPRTIEELAQALEITGNAVRAHITAMERDGLVEQQGSKRTEGARKPSAIYRLTAGAERMFPKAHAALLPYLLEVLREREPGPDAETETLKEIGRRIGAGRSRPDDSEAERLDSALSALRELGGLPEVEASDDTYIIRGYSCPFSPVVKGEPGLCHVAQGMLAEIVGKPVEECCERGAEGSAVWCRFEVPRGGRAG